MAKHKKSFAGVGDDLFSAMTPQENTADKVAKQTEEPKTENKVQKAKKTAKQAKPEQDSAPEYVMKQGSIHKSLYLYAKTRARQLQINVYEYMNILVNEARESHFYESLDPFNEEQKKLFNFLGDKTRFSFKLTKENSDWLDQTSIFLGVSPARLLNRIMANEKSREKKDGFRKL